MIPDPDEPVLFPTAAAKMTPAALTATLVTSRLAAWCKTNPSPAGEIRRISPPGSVPTMMLSFESIASDRACVSSVLKKLRLSRRRLTLWISPPSPVADEEIATAVERHRPDVFGFRIVETCRTCHSRRHDKPCRRELSRRTRDRCLSIAIDWICSPGNSATVRDLPAASTATNLEFALLGLPPPV